ncbi:SDR family oxidoreductase [Streptomyces sp. NPDC051001]|uniref:SDR family oxidoreductase n=1 Tax=Streptomyces sp. NPDC051001 TaxID=3155795 RepID=UPI00342970BD
MPLFLVRQGLGRLRAGGRIINISSAATRVAFRDSVVCSMAKAVLETLPQALTKELGPRGVTVNQWRPGS